MKPTDLLPGTKVDINVIQLINNETESIGNLKSTYFSSVYDVYEDGTIELYMPMEETKLRILPKNLRYEFIFHLEKNIYKAEGVVVAHLKRGSVYLLKAEITSEIKKFQRREYFRLECLIPATFLTVSEETAKRATFEQVLFDLEENKTPQKRFDGTLLDISGGGSRFVAPESLEEEKYLLIRFYIPTEEGQKQIEILAEVILSQKMPDDEKYVHRTKFLYKDHATKDQIIRYIFEEERRIRKKEQGLL